MPRNINEFKGEAIIIGGGWCSDHCIAKPPIRNPDNFYTIDKEKKAAPDAVLDITDDIQCSILPEKRFSLIYFESFPFYSGEKQQLQQAFNITRRILKEDGILIYRGGSNKSTSSITDILKNAGYPYTLKKDLDPMDPKSVYDNGSISLASNIDIKSIQENFPNLPETLRYYLTYYKFFSKEPFSFYSHKNKGITDLGLFGNKRLNEIKFTNNISLLENTQQTYNLF